MLFYHKYSVDDPELNPMYETQEAKGGSVDDFQFAGYELSAKYNVLSPFKDAFGLLFGLGYEKRYKYRLDGADILQDSYVGTVFLQKNYYDNLLTIAATLKNELERRKSGNVLEEEIAIDYALGVSYRSKPKHFIGFETRIQADFLNSSE